jgi:hypothetical protein
LNQDDEQMLANIDNLKEKIGPGWKNYMNAIIVRLGEKRLLHHVLDFLKASAGKMTQNRSKRRKLE